MPLYFWPKALIPHDLEGSKEYLEGRIIKDKVSATMQEVGVSSLTYYHRLVAAVMDLIAVTAIKNGLI